MQQLYSVVSHTGGREIKVYTYLQFGRLPLLEANKDLRRLLPTTAKAILGRRRLGHAKILLTVQNNMF